MILAPYAYFYPECAASSYLWQNLHEDFAKNELYCYVCAPIPTRGVSKEMRQEYRFKKKEIMYDGKLQVRRFWLWNEPRGVSMRFLRYFVQCVRQYFTMVSLGKECDVIFAASTPPIIGAMCALVKRIRKMPFVYSLQDIFPDSMVGNELASHGGMLWKLGRVIESYTYKHADRIIVISEGFKKNIMAKGVPKEKIEVVYNWVEQDNVTDVPRENNKLFDKYGLDRTKFYVTYNGNIGMSQNVDMLIDVAKELETIEDIHFVLVGNGVYKGRLEQIVKERNVKNVTLLPFQPYEDIKYVFSLGDASLVISKPNVGANSVPSKTWSIMSASRPVLANFDENELKNILEGTIVSTGLKTPKGPCGIFTKAGDEESFKRSILTLYNNRDLCREYGSNGRQFILDNLTREVGAQKYVDIIKSLERK